MAAEDILGQSSQHSALGSPIYFNGTDINQALPLQLILKGLQSAELWQECVTQTVSMKQLFKDPRESTKTISHTLEQRSPTVHKKSGPRSDQYLPFHYGVHQTTTWTLQNDALGGHVHSPLPQQTLLMDFQTVAAECPVVQVVILWAALRNDKCCSWWGTFKASIAPLLPALDFPYRMFATQHRRIKCLWQWGLKGFLFSKFPLSHNHSIALFFWAGNQGLSPLLITATNKKKYWFEDKENLAWILKCHFYDEGKKMY